MIRPVEVVAGAFRRRPFSNGLSGNAILLVRNPAMAALDPESVDLIITSPPFGLVRKKDYGNVESHEYVDWVKPFAREFKPILKPTGSRWHLATQR